MLMPEVTVTPFLWFNNNLDEAMVFYQGVFENATSAVMSSKPDGSAMSASFTLAGQKFLGLNGGPMFKFNEAVSFFISCETQEDIDHYWDKLLEGGTPSRCGWLKDKFGLSWQVVPVMLGAVLGHPDPQKAQRAMQAMLTMNKLDIALLKKSVE